MKPERDSAANESRRPIERADTITAQVREMVGKDGRGIVKNCFSPLLIPPVNPPHARSARLQPLCLTAAD